VKCKFQQNIQHSCRDTTV